MTSQWMTVRILQLQIHPVCLFVRHTPKHLTHWCAVAQLESFIKIVPHPHDAVRWTRIIDLDAERETDTSGRPLTTTSSSTSQSSTPSRAKSIPWRPFRMRVDYFLTNRIFDKHSREEINETLRGLNGGWDPDGAKYTVTTLQDYKDMEQVLDCATSYVGPVRLLVAEFTSAVS